MNPPNRLHYGDCLAVMDAMPEAGVDLVYLDPPFNSNRDYAAIYKHETGRRLPARTENFSDTWRLDKAGEACLRRLPARMQAHALSETARRFWQHWIAALRASEPAMLAYIAYMAERVLAMRRLLKPGGSLFFHCDPTAGHYVKLMLDSIFGRDNFRNEIVWCYTGPAAPHLRQFNRKHDVIFWYSNGPGWTFNKDSVRLPHAGGSPHAGGFGTGGRRADDPHYAALGKVPESWWRDIAIAPRSASEYLGYATQKPLALLRRIILAASNPGDMVLDPFCGSATTLHAAHELGRRWTGIDSAVHAVESVARNRLARRCGLLAGRDYLLAGLPEDAAAARALRRRDPQLFEKWAIEKADGLAAGTGANGNGFADGRLYFALPGERRLHSMLLCVGDLRRAAAAVDALQHADGALLCGAILPARPGKAQRAELQALAARAGDVDMLGESWPRLQFLSVDELLQGARFRLPAPASAPASPRGRP